MRLAMQCQQVVLQTFRRSQAADSLHASVAALGGSQLGAADSLERDARGSADSMDAVPRHASGGAAAKGGGRAEAASALVDAASLSLLMG